MPRDRGAEQGDAAGPQTECSLASGMVAAEARVCVAMQQAARTLTGIGAGDSLCRMNNAIEGSGSETSSSAAQKNSPRRRSATRSAGKKLEAWQTSGIWMMVTSSVTPYWFCSDLQAFKAAPA